MSGATCNICVNNGEMVVDTGTGGGGAIAMRLQREKEKTIEGGGL